MTGGVETRGGAEIESWLAALLEALGPDRRAALFRGLARDLRRRASARMGKQTDPEGRPWRPRGQARDGAGQVRGTARMFRGLRKARRLKAQGDAHGLSVGWRGRDALLARAHQSGGVAGDRTPVPARPLIGFSETEIALARAAILEALAG